MPTLTESGIDLVFLNWRGVLAPPGISDERTDELIGYLEEMHDTEEWQEALDRQRLDRRLQDRRRVRASSSSEQDDRVSGTLEELGLL